MKSPLPPKHRRLGFTFIELLVAVLLLAVLAALLIPIGRGAYARAKTAACLSNLRSLSTIFHSYAAEHNGEVRFLRDGTGANMWYSELRKHADLTETEAQKAFGCPAVRWRDTGAWNCYGMRLGYLNTPVATDPGFPIERFGAGATYGFRISRVLSPATFLVFADSATASGKQNFRIADRGLYNGGGIILRHSGVGHALFLDGHVESLDAAGFGAVGITAMLDEELRQVKP